MKSEALLLGTGRLHLADLVALSKPRLNALVVATAAGGYYLGASPSIDAATWLHVVVGTALVAAGASAFNQYLERRTDAVMHRTRRRPLPGGRLQPQQALAFAAAASLLGLAQLAIGANWLAAATALFTLLTYAIVYTPLKLRTSLATVVGAIPGAIPPMIGWAGATATLSREAWVLFALVFLWQMPHFLAIAWLYRDDFARAGFPFLPVVEPEGRSTARQVVTYAAALLPVSLAPTLIGLAGHAYFVVALVLTSSFLGLSIAFAVRRDVRAARWLFLASITYLPLLWVAMIADRVR